MLIITKYYVLKALYFTILDQCHEAIRCYDKAIEINPNSADIWYNKGIVYNKLGNSKEAEQCSNRARQLIEGDRS